MASIEITLGLEKIKTTEFWRAVFAEFVGLALFLLMVTSAVVSWAHTVDKSAHILKISFAIGLAITMLVISFAHVSGAHLNPAVTAGMIVAGKISIIQGLCYIIAQIVGAIVGSALMYSLTTDETRGNLAVPEIGHGASLAQGFGVELLFTFILVFVVFSLTDENKKIDPFCVALGVGLTVTALHISGIPLTSCSINPARAIGPAIVMGKFEDHWIYWMGPILGGIFASFAYNLIFYVKVSKNSKKHFDNHNGEMEFLTK